MSEKNSKNSARFAGKDKKNSNSESEDEVEVTIPEDRKEKEKVSLAKLAKGLGTLKEQNKDLIDRIEKIEESSDRHEEDIKFLAETAQETDKRMFHAEMERVKNNLIIKNLPHGGKKGEGEETHAQTRSECEKLLKALGIADKVKLTSSKRFPGGNPERGPAMVKITLASPSHKAIVFKALSKGLKDKNLSKVVISNEYPAALRPLFKKAESEAYKIRTDSKRTVKTRIIPKDGGVQLFVMGPKDKTFSLEKVFPAKICDPELYKSIPKKDAA